MNPIVYTVQVLADDAGNVVVPSKNNQAYGHIRLRQNRMVVDERGFSRKRFITALLPGLVADLKCYDWKANQMIEGCIYSKEQLIPFNPKEPKRDYKIAGKTEVICTIDGQPMYRKTFYSPDSLKKDVHILDEQNQIVTHDNGDYIRAAYKALAEANENEEQTIDTNLGTM